METQGSLSFSYRAHLHFDGHIFPSESQTKKRDIFYLKAIKFPQRTVLNDSLIEKTQRIWEYENRGQSLSNTDSTAQ